MKKALLGLVLSSSFGFELATAMNLSETISNPSPSTVAQVRKISKSDEMKSKIQQNLLRELFYRPDLVDIIRPFLPETVSTENFPKHYQTEAFFDFLEKHNIKIKVAENTQKEPNKKMKLIITPKRQADQWLKSIIEEDRVEQLQERAEENMTAVLGDSFFEAEHMQIPILHYSAIKKAIKCFKFLILNGADPSQTLNWWRQDKYHWDCMAVAIASGEWEMMKILEERGINKQINPAVWEAAALTHRNNILKLFISNKEEIPNFGECIQKGLGESVEGNNLKGVILLSKAGADVNAKNVLEVRPLCVAAIKDFNELGKILISAGADINAKNSYGVTPLHFAADKDSYEIGELLISAGADINARNKDGRTPLHYAVAKDSIEMGELLISKGADINAIDEDGETPLHQAAEHDSNEIGKLLISKGADINAKNKNDETPLHVAADQNSNKMGEVLISAGADINAKDEWEQTPLHIAAWYNSNEVGELLISNNADINARSEDGRTPLHDAAVKDSIEMGKLLISKGADINAQDNEGATPLHIAWFHESEEEDDDDDEKKTGEIGELLISAGADINVKDKFGLAPLHWAAWKDFYERGELLISKGADINTRNNQGQTPLCFAKKGSMMEKLLLSHGANK